MKIIVVSDLHGKDVWKKIDVAQYDKIVFLGDYVDDWTKSDATIVDNLQQIIEFKKSNEEKVILLLGNHDLPYIFPDEHFGCSGYRESYANTLYQIFNQDLKCFQMAYQIDSYLFTHAGVCSYWYDEKLMKSKYIEYMVDFNVAEKLNALLETADRKLYWNSYSPIWIRPSQMHTNVLRKFHQVVGHTELSGIVTKKYGEASIVYCDVLNNVDHMETFYTIEY
jgi:predicted MPP superfamily phosphohydrolase